MNPVQLYVAMFWQKKTSSNYTCSILWLSLEEKKELLSEKKIKGSHFRAYIPIYTRLYAPIYERKFVEVGISCRVGYFVPKC